MKTNCSSLPYSDTGYFSKLVLDHLVNRDSVLPYRFFSPTMESIQQATERLVFSPEKRSILVEVLKEQYAGVAIDAIVNMQLEKLLQPNCFTITTAHQPNIFSGPLYVIYKIAHVIKLAEAARKENAHQYFVPVFYVGSEDADLEEIGSVNIGKKLLWSTGQSGAVGRMKVDANFIQLIDAISNEVNNTEYGEELLNIFKTAYQEGQTIASGTRHLMNTLFGRFGLIVLDPDHPKLKRLFNPVVKKEILEQFSNQRLMETVKSLSLNYNVQTAGREINLFYLRDNFRERIIKTSEDEFESGLLYRWRTEALLSEIDQHPDRFSTNVVLRPLFQQTILPDVAFVGGGGELAYWLELQDVFSEANIFYPPLILRNSFLLVGDEEAAVMRKFSLEEKDLFLPLNALVNDWVLKQTQSKLQLNVEISRLQEVYKEIEHKAVAIDASLATHTKALAHVAIKKLHVLEKKFLKAEKKKFRKEELELSQLKSKLFPHNNLQERVENFSLYYARFGKQFIDTIVDSSAATKQQFSVIYFED